MVGGDDRVSRYLDPTTNEDYDVQLRLDKQYRSDADTIARLYVPSQAGGLVRLDNVVKIEEGQAPSRIERLDRQRTVRFFAGVGPGYALGDRVVALRKALADMNLPAAYSVTVLGRGREMERTFAEFALAFLLSIAFMYMILASQFESLIDPLTILISLPLSVPFALFSLWATADTLNLYSALGVLVLFGIVKKNSILQIDHMNNLRRLHGLSRDEAVMQGNRDRLRPILMTTFALVAGMLPLALGTGPGAEERRSIAIVVIGGQTLSLLLTLVATPVFYTLIEDLTLSPRWRALVGRVRRADRRRSAARSSSAGSRSSRGAPRAARPRAASAEASVMQPGCSTPRRAMSRSRPGRWCSSASRARARTPLLVSAVERGRVARAVPPHADAGRPAHVGRDDQLRRRRLDQRPRRLPILSRRSADRPAVAADARRRFSRSRHARRSARASPAFVPDACLVNRYDPGARLTLHQDRDERDFAAPIVSVSLGLPAVFLFGGERRADSRCGSTSRTATSWCGAARRGCASTACCRSPMAGTR